MLLYLVTIYLMYNIISQKHYLMVFMCLVLYYINWSLITQIYWIKNQSIYLFTRFSWTGVFWVYSISDIQPCHHCQIVRNIYCPKSPTYSHPLSIIPFTFKRACSIIAITSEHMRITNFIFMFHTRYLLEHILYLKIGFWEIYYYSQKLCTVIYRSVYFT